MKVGDQVIYNDYYSNYRDVKAAVMAVGISDVRNGEGGKMADTIIEFNHQGSDLQVYCWESDLKPAPTKPVRQGKKCGCKTTEHGEIRCAKHFNEGKKIKMVIDARADNIITSGPATPTPTVRVAFKRGRPCTYHLGEQPTYGYHSSLCCPRCPIHDSRAAIKEQPKIRPCEKKWYKVSFLISGTQPVIHEKINRNGVTITVKSKSVEHKVGYGEIIVQEVDG